MRSPTIFRALTTTAALLLVGLSAARTQAEQVVRQNFATKSGVVLLGYAPKTHAEIVNQKGVVVWKGDIDNVKPEPLPLPDGAYELRTADDVKIVSINYLTYNQPIAPVAQDKPVGGVPLRGRKPLGGVGVFSLVPVPAVKDASYANNPPSFASSHVIFTGVPTRLKVVINGGTAPYGVTWDPGDGRGFQPYFQANNPAVDAAQSFTYSSANVLPGQQFHATVKVTDSMGVTAQASYWMLVGDPTKQADRINRASDEGLWYLHGQLILLDDQSVSNPFNNTVEPTVNEGYIPAPGNSVHSSAMYAIDLENTGRSITGGKNFSNDPSKDAYVDDLNRLINVLTDYRNLPAADLTGFNKTYTGLGTFAADTHGPGGVSNGIALFQPSGYEAGPQLQAISQAGFVNEAVPNRSEYASYYDLIGDAVDGLQAAQGSSGYAEGGWRYSISQYANDSDGSTVAWTCIGLRAAEVANRNTPGPASGYKPAIPVAQFVRDALNQFWLNADQTATSQVYAYDYGRGGVNHYFDQLGGMGYTVAGYGPNAGKTGGGLVAFALALPRDAGGNPISDQRVSNSLGFLYRNFNNYDYNFNWSSARDAYGMYNILKGLSEFGVTTLTDPTGSAGNDRDGFALAPFNWFSRLTDFIVGTSDTDLGHQTWGANLVGYGSDGHFLSTGYRTGEWSNGASDSSGGVNLITAWDIATMQSAVFVPPPIPVIFHPSVAAGETYIPVQLNGADYFAVFDPATSYELNPNAAITHVHWDFGDNSSDDYDLPFASPPGGAVPGAPGVHPVGNQTKHHYTTVGDYTVTLTITDTAGTSNSATQTVHVIPAPFPPTAVLAVTPVAPSRQDGDTVGVLADGTVKLTIDASGSFNIGADSVLAPKNAKGISAFAFEWPTLAGGTVVSDPISASGPFNSGLSESPLLFDEGADASGSGLNPGSKAATQVYTFQFDPNNLPSAITLALTVTSNIVQTNGQPPKTATIFKQIFLKKNADINPGRVLLKGLYVHNITDTTAIVSFDTTDGANTPINTTAVVTVGGHPVSDGLSGKHHDIVLTSLTPFTTYHYTVKATDSFANSITTSDATFKTLPTGTVTLQLTGSKGAHTSSLIETITYKITNTSVSDAVSFNMSGFVANNGVTFNSVVGTVPTTIPAGTTISVAVKWNLPSFPFGPNNSNKLGWSFLATWKNSATPAASYSKSISGALIVQPISQ